MTNTQLTNDNQEIEILAEKLFQNISSYVVAARQNIKCSIDVEMVKAYWLTGHDIVESSQEGNLRAKYGTFLLKKVSSKLTAQHGSGFSVENLKRMRQFYIAFKDIPPIGYAARTQFKKTLNPNLSWMHYRALMRVDRLEARAFYEIEALKNNWTGRELERQINSLLFDRLAKSKDKAGLLKLANKGHEIDKPEDAIKEPVVLEFLDIPESNKLVESKLEEALITNLQKFLLEMGAGLAYVGRQKRLMLDGDRYNVDLVFYSIPLKAYCLIDLKVAKLTHADVGQMLLYVNYFDRQIKGKDDNPTIGLILCTEKSNEMVKYMLSEDNKQIFASKYQLHLPSKETLEAELKREIELLEDQLSEHE
jgi:predicted nuclease of restriction endonuclease-like (RecB) superfamily